MKTVKEIIEVLSKLDSNMPVLRGDNSGGLENIYEIYVSKITHILPNKEGSNLFKKGDTIEAVVLE